MAICTFFQQGRCKFGDRCKYEHPHQTSIGSQNRFGVLSGGGGFGAGKARPEWIFSAYGPGKNAPRQLFGGPQREQSFEEMRLRHYEAAASGNANVAIQEAEALYAESVRQMETILSDLNGAVKYVLDGENEHPNRIDISEGRTGPAMSQAPSAFGQPSPFGQPAAQTSAFGQPSSLGGSQSAFGKPSAFAQPSAFGQPSALGQGSAFGQPSALGQGSAFGQPSGLGPQGAFGKPAFGQPSLGQAQPAFGQPAFGQPSAPGTSAFGQPSTISPFSQISNQNQATGGGFGQPSAQKTASPFGQPSVTPGFGQSTAGFGQPSQGPSPFGQVQQAQQPASSFGQPAPAATPFGAPAQQPTPSPFGHPAAPGPSPFGQPAAAAAPVTTVSTGPAPTLKVEPQELNPIPPLNGPTTRDPATQKLSTWKGQPVKYINDWPCYLHPDDRQTYVHIFFPDGPPDPQSLRDAQGKPEEYTPEVTEQYEFFVKNGYFKDGVIPNVPPKTEWVSFDF